MEDPEKIFERFNECYLALRRSEEQLDFALEAHRSITKALRESRKARNELIKLLMEANIIALRDKKEW